MNIFFLIFIFVGAQSSREFLVVREGGVEYCSVSCVWGLQAGVPEGGIFILNLPLIRASSLFFYPPPPNLINHQFLFFLIS